MRLLTNEEINIIAGGVAVGDNRWVAQMDEEGRSSEQQQVYGAQYYEGTFTGYGWNACSSSGSESAY